MRQSLENARDALDRLLADKPAVNLIETVAELLAETFRAGGKVLACGNGGSACDAMHFCEELTGRFRDERPPLPAIACIDPGHITCTANDYGFEHVFSRWVEALGKPGDVLVALSTSGNSPNVDLAIQQANKQAVHTVGLLGAAGGVIKGQCKHEWIIPGQTSDRIQEIHMLILHTLIECVEQRLFPESRASTAAIEPEQDR
jgi:D-sedoheptulose 7-phosphate isomerase